MQKGKGQKAKGKRCRWAQKTRTQPRHGQITCRGPRVLSPTNIDGLLCSPPSAVFPPAADGLWPYPRDHCQLREPPAGSVPWVAPQSAHLTNEDPGRPGWGKAGQLR